MLVGKAAWYRAEKTQQSVLCFNFVFECIFSIDFELAGSKVEGWGEECTTFLRDNIFFPST